MLNPRLLRSLFALLGAASIVSGCGGGYDEGYNTDGEPTKAAISGTPARINFQAAAQDAFLELVSEEGLCLVNQTTGISVVVGDQKGRPIENASVEFHVEEGRGLLPASARTDDTGTASVTFQSICAPNFGEVITLLAITRGAEPFSDLNSNGRFDGGESYLDRNGNLRYDGGEPFTDGNRNGRHDDGEPFRDLNANGLLDGEAFADSNGNGTLDGEPFIDLDIEVYLDSELDGIFDPARGDRMIVDRNGNRSFDAGGNGQYDTNAVLVSVTVIIPSGPDGLPVESVDPNGFDSE